METAPARRRRQIAAAWCVIASLWMASGPLAVAAPTADPSCRDPSRRTGRTHRRLALVARRRATAVRSHHGCSGRSLHAPSRRRADHRARRRRDRLWQRHADRRPRTVRTRDHQLARRPRFARHRRSRLPERLPLPRPPAQGRQRLGPRGARDLAAADRTGPRLDRRRRSPATCSRSTATARANTASPPAAAPPTTRRS